MDGWLVVLAVYVAASLVAFAIYALDKWRAKRARPRVPESTLHLAELLCGWPGALLAMTVFRHKTHKTRFRVVTFVIVFLHLLGWSTFGWFRWHAPM